MKSRSVLLCSSVVVAGALESSAAFAACPAPGPEEVVVYEHRGATGRCRVLPIGTFHDASQFSPVPNNSISAINVGSNVRAVLYDSTNEGGRLAHYEGGFMYDMGSSDNDRASSIEVFLKAGGTAATFYLGNHPSNKESFYTDLLNGFAHSDQHWFVTQQRWLWRLPLGWDLNDNVWTPDRPSVPIPAGFEHFGDLDVMWGFVFVPITGPNQVPSVAVYDTDLTLRAIAPFPERPSKATGDSESDVGWLALNPATGNLWASGSKVSASTPIREYSIDWVELFFANNLVLTPVGERILQTRTGNPVELTNMQGGAVNPEGTLIYLSNGYCKFQEGAPTGIRIFELSSGVLQAESGNGYGPFNYQHNSNTSVLCSAEEPEGLDYFDVTQPGLPVYPPQIHGQLHAILIDSDLGTDNFWFKHYEF